jgi:hypothetical protein
VAGLYLDLLYQIKFSGEVASTRLVCRFFSRRHSVRIFPYPPKLKGVHDGKLDT